MIFDLIRTRRSVFPAQYNNRSIDKAVLEQILDGLNTGLYYTVSAEDVNEIFVVLKISINLIMIELKISAASRISMKVFN